MAAGARRSVQALLLLQCLLRECAVLAHLTMTEHGPAQQHILAMRQLLGRFPSLLPGALHSIQMVTGAELLAFRGTQFCTASLCSRPAGFKPPTEVLHQQDHLQETGDRDSTHMQGIEEAIGGVPFRR